MADERTVGAGAAGPATVGGMTADPSNPNFQAAVAASAALTTLTDCGQVKALQSAWNAASGDGGVGATGGPVITVDGVYGTNTANANAAIAQASGGGNTPGPLDPSQYPNCNGAPPQQTVTCPDGSVHPAGYVCPGGNITPSGGLPTWAKWLIGLLAAAAVVGLGLWLYKRYGSESMAGERKRKRGRKSKR